MLDGGEPGDELAEYDPFAGGRAVSELRWEDHPAKRHPWSLAFFAAALLTVGVAVTEIFGNRWVGAAAALGLAVCFRGFLLKTTYTLDDAGAEARGLLGAHVVGWEEVRRFRHDPAGAALGVAGSPGLRDKLTALRLTFTPAAGRKQVVRFVLSRLPAGARVTAEE